MAQLSRFDLRDISVRLSLSSDVNGVVFELLRTLEDAHPEWRASVAFYEVSADALVDVYEREENRLIRRHMTTRVDSLPPAMVSALFSRRAPAPARATATEPAKPRGDDGSASNGPEVAPAGRRRAAPEPRYLAQPADAVALFAFISLSDWRSCVCLAIVDKEDLLGLLVVASPKKGAFGEREIAEILVVQRIATLALAYHLDRSAWEMDRAQNQRVLGELTTKFQTHLEELVVQSEQLVQENAQKTHEIELLAEEQQDLNRDASSYRQELQKVKVALSALEEQTSAAAEFISIADIDAATTQWQLSDLDYTLGFMRELFRMLGQEHDPREFPHLMLAWFGEQFGIERCSLMVPEAEGDTLRIQAEYGVEPELTQSVRVRIGHGVAGWVALHRRPLLVRMRGEVEAIARPREGAYNSDSFVVVPLVYNQRLVGVLSAANKKGGEAFDEMDLDRVMLAGAVLASLLRPPVLPLAQAA